MTLRLVTEESLKAQNIERRMARVLRKAEAGQLTDAQLRYAMDHFERGDIPYAEMPSDFDPNQHLGEASGEGRIAEFTGNAGGRFGLAWFTRHQQEVQNGREQVPLLIGELYNVIYDPNIQEVETIFTVGPDDVGVMFEKIMPGGELSWATFSGGQKTIRQYHWAKGIAFDEHFAMFFRPSKAAMVERAFGRAANAVQNHVHFEMVINHSYEARQQTDGRALTGPEAFRSDASMAEKYHRTLEAAIVHARDDSKYHRPGPYALMVSHGDLITARRALENPQQQGFSQVSTEVIDSITRLVAYRGWQGKVRNESFRYPGIPTGTARLIDLSQQDSDFQSLYKQDLMMKAIGPDLARFIVERTRWNMWFGTYCAPDRAVEHITWPTASDGISASE